MGSVVQWILATGLVVSGVGLGLPFGMDEGSAWRSATASAESHRFAQTTLPDDEPLDADVGEPPAQDEPPPEEPADDEPLDVPPADDEELDDEALDAGAPAPEDEEPLDQGAPSTAAAPGPADQPASQPAPVAAPAAKPVAEPVPAAEPAAKPAAAPAPAAEPAAKPTYHPEPVYYPEPIYEKPTSAKPVYYPAPIWPFDHGGVYVNAGFAPDAEFPFSSGFDTCENQVRLGRAYVGVGCQGADVTVGHLPAPWQADDDRVPSVVQRPITESKPVPVVVSPTTFPGFTVDGAASDGDTGRRATAPSGSSGSRTPARVVRGESRTTTTTTIIDRDGDVVVDESQGADNETDIGRRGGNTNRTRNTNGNRQQTTSAQEADTDTNGNVRTFDQETAGDEKGKSDTRDAKKADNDDHKKQKKQSNQDDEQKDNEAERAQEVDGGAKQQPQAVKSASCDERDRTKDDRSSEGKRDQRQKGRDGAGCGEKKAGGGKND